MRHPALATPLPSQSSIVSSDASSSIAAALLETDDYDQEAVEKYMKEVPKAIRKIVGKSIPIEVSLIQVLARD